MLALTVIFSTLVATVLANVSRQVTLDPNAPYILSYTVLNETSSNPTWQATLNISNVKSASSWPTDGKSGFFMGLGYGKKFMMNIDFTMC